MLNAMPTTASEIYGTEHSVTSRQGGQTYTATVRRADGQMARRYEMDSTVTPLLLTSVGGHVSAVGPTPATGPEPAAAAALPDDDGGRAYRTAAADKRLDRRVAEDRRQRQAATDAAAAAQLAKLTELRGRKLRAEIAADLARIDDKMIAEAGRRSMQANRAIYG